MQEIGRELAKTRTKKHVIDSGAIKALVYPNRHLMIRRNCQRWFLITGRSTAEYCDATLDVNGRTCKERGAIRKWTQARSKDLVFLEYRREYKRRFAWIRAGRISESRFYVWSAKAGEMKAECDKGTISLEEFKDWLGRP